MLQAGEIVFGLQEGGQRLSVGNCLGKFAGAMFEDQQQIIADVAAFLAEIIVHPDPLASYVNPTATLEICQVARHG